MKINTLSYSYFDQNGGSFELLIDNIPLAEQINFEDSLIPFWIVGDGIPTFPPHQVTEQISERIVAVCGCGEYGCDCAVCQVEIEKDFVTFSQFRRPGYSHTVDKTFKFTKKNFEDIENQIAKEAEKIKDA